MHAKSSRFISAYGMSEAIAHVYQLVISRLMIVSRGGQEEAGRTRQMSELFIQVASV